MVCGVFFALPAKSTLAGESRRVLLLHAFGHPFSPWSDMAGSFRAELVKKSTEPINLYEVSLDTGRVEDAQHEEPYRKRLGMDHGLVVRQAQSRRAKAVLHSGKSTRRYRTRQLRPLSAHHQNSTQGSQRRLAPVRVQLLPPLPTGRAPRAAGRYVNKSRRISVRHSRARQWVKKAPRHQAPKTVTDC